MNLAMASSAVGTGPNTSRWRAVSATYRPDSNHCNIAFRSLAISFDRSAGAAAVLAGRVGPRASR